MKPLEITLIFSLLFAMFMCGYMVREVQGQYVADAYLTEKVQEVGWDVKGLEQLNMQLERGDFYDVIIPLCNEDKDESTNNGR